MCGRYNLVHDPSLWRLARPIQARTRPAFQARYNIAPGQMVPVYRGADRHSLELVDMRWGFVPSFVRDEKPRSRPINARADTVFEKPWFRDAVRRRRCLLPATGFYEWRTENGHKEPYHVHLAASRPFLLAGIWDCQEGDPERPTVAVLTTEAPPDLRWLHDRVPVIIPNEMVDHWLDEPDDRLLLPLPAGVLQATRIGRRVNRVENDDAELLWPLRT